MAQAAWGNTGKPLKKLEYVPLDNNWIQKLPEGSSITSAVGYGASYWSQSGKVDVSFPDGSSQSFFIKLSETDLGKKMAIGEFHSMKELNRISPELAPAPLGYGTFESDPNTHFFLCDYVDMVDETPDIVDFCSGVADLHRRSMDFSPNNMFGFHVPTCNATVLQNTAWNPSWEAFWTESLKNLFRLEAQAQGNTSPAIKRLLPALYDKVIPRLLRPLETEGRILRPCLLHADLWDGNVGVHSDSRGRSFSMRPHSGVITNTTCMPGQQHGSNSVEHGKWSISIIFLSPRRKTIGRIVPFFTASILVCTTLFFLTRLLASEK